MPVIVAIVSLTLATMGHTTNVTERVRREGSQNREKISKIEPEDFVAPSSIKVLPVPSTKINVAAILAAATAERTRVEIEAILRQSLVQRTDAEVAEIVQAAFASGSTVQIQAILAALFATRTEVVAQTILRQSLVQRTDAEVAEIVQAALASGSTVQIQAILAALFATRTDVEAKRILKQSFAEIHHMNILDILDGGKFTYLVRSLKVARMNGDSKREKELIAAIFAVLMEDDTVEKIPEVVK